MEAPEQPQGEAIARLLQKVSLFEGLEANQLEQVVALIRSRAVDAGETVFREGDAGDAFYIVFRGSVEIGKSTPGGGEERLAIRRPGEGFGEMALLNDAPRSASAVALERGELLSLGRQEFQELMGPETPAFRMLSSLSRALRALDVRFAAREREKVGAELREFDAIVMAGMLPDTLPQVPGYRIKATPMGNPDDLKDAIWDSFAVKGGETAMAVMAASGASAFPPSHTLSLARMALRSVAALLSKPGEILAVANRVLVEQAAPGAEVTCDVGLVVLGPDGMTWSGAGHPQASVLVEGQSGDVLPVHGPPLGMLEGFTYATATLEHGEGRGVSLRAGTAPVVEGGSGPVEVEIIEG
ncbi:MAG: cyclic nucleotide-binding domain-containing protein [Gemmatimonadota bacterium]